MWRASSQAREWDVRNSARPVLLLFLEVLRLVRLPDLPSLDLWPPRVPWCPRQSGEPCAPDLLKLIEMSLDLLEERPWRGGGGGISSSGAWRGAGRSALGHAGAPRPRLDLLQGWRCARCGHLPTRDVPWSGTPAGCPSTVVLEARELILVNILPPSSFKPCSRL